jgi:hypothetical protein
LTNRWCLGIWPASLICACLLGVLNPVTEATAQAPGVCAQCADKQKALDAKKEKLKDLEWELNETADHAAQIVFQGTTASASDLAVLSRLNDKRKKLEADISTARDAIAKLESDLAGCVTDHRCGAAVKPNAVPATAPMTHPYPLAACGQCEGDAKKAQAALSNVLRDEAAVARARLRIFELKGWLSAHAGDQSTEAYKDNVKNLGDYERDLKDSEAKRAEDQRQLDELMANLAKCNAQYKGKCKPPATTPLDGSPYYPLSEVRAECPDCEGLALKLEADIAELRRAELRLALDRNRLRDLISTAKTRDERKAIEKAEKDLENDLAVDKKTIEDIAQVIVNEFKALDECNKAHPSASCPPPAGRNMFPGGAPPMQEIESETTMSSHPTISSPAGGGAPGPAPPGGAGEPRAPPVPPPALPGITTEPAPAPPLETKPMGAGGFVNPPGAFTFSAGPGLVIDKPISLGVYPVTDSAVLRGPTRIDTIALNVGVNNFAPSWLPNYGFNFSGMDGNRTTSTQVPVGIQSGWVYQIAAPNGSTGISSNGGLNASLKTTFYDINFGFTLPSQAIKDEDSSKIWLDRLAWIRYAKTKYGGMVSIALNPDISSTTDQNLNEYDLGAGIGLRGEHTFPNRFVGSVGIGADLILYHANYSGSQDNICPVCSPAEHNFNISTSDSANRFALGASATAGLSYPVSTNGSLFFKVMYRAEFAAPILVNKISPSNLAPHLSTGTRQSGGGLFGFSVNF